MALTHIDLFAGIGGFSLGLERAGVRTTAAVEIDKPCQAVLEREFPDVRLFNDIQEVNADDLLATGFEPHRGIITAGFPCQDISSAGRGAGLAGDRSGLFWEIVRLLADLQPRWFLLENVPRLLTINGGRDMGTVLWALGELGYWIAWRVLDAQFFGVPQRRRRIFIVGSAKYTGGDPGKVLFEPEGRGLHPPATGEAGTQGTPGAHASARSGGIRVDPVAALTANGVGTCGADDNQAQAGHLLAATLDGKLGVRRVTPTECEGLQGFPAGHTAGQSDAARYKQLGNAVCVPVVEWIAHRLVDL